MFPTAGVLGNVVFRSGTQLSAVRVDGVVLSSLVPYASIPDPSTDGHYLTYAQNQELAIYDTARKAGTYPCKQGTMPRRSPIGDRIAFIWL